MPSPIPYPSPPALDGRNGPDIMSGRADPAPQPVATFRTAVPKLHWATQQSWFAWQGYRWDSPVACSNRWTKQNNAGELRLVVTITESWQVYQPTYHPGPKQFLWFGPSQHPLNLQTAGACEGNGSKAEESPWHKSKRQNQDIQE